MSWPAESSPMRDKAVVLVSGGMDSCVSAAIALQHRECAFLHVSYGQKTEARELGCFHRLADHYEVTERLVVRLPHLAEIGGSSLTDASMPVADAAPGNPGVPPTYVPFRNAQLLSAGVAWAEVLGASRVYIGAVEQDATGYPDCRREFFDAFEQAIAAGTRAGGAIRIETPVITLSKTDIVGLAFELDAPLHLTWSCYRSSDIACGRCDSCVLRLEAFEAAGRPDPLPYERGGPGATSAAR